MTLFFPKAAQLSKESLNRAVMFLERYFSCIKKKECVPPSDKIYSFSNQNAIRRRCQGVALFCKQGPSGLFWRLNNISENLYSQEVSMPCLSEVTCQFFDLWKNFLFSGTQFIQLQVPDGVYLLLESMVDIITICEILQPKQGVQGCPDLNWESY